MTRLWRTSGWWLGPLAVVSGLFCMGSLAAQDAVLRGRIITLDDQAVPDWTVVLHGVESAGGAPVARTITDSAGRFALELPDSAATDAIYFAAVRYGSGLYVGPMFRGPPGTEPYEIVVGGEPAFAAGPSSAARTSGRTVPGSNAPARPAREMWWIIGLACLTAAALIWLAFARHGRPSEQRRLLRELALLDERRHTSAAPASSAESEREALVHRLRQTVRE